MDQVVTEVRTRFAPSPTGFMHVGNLRTALYAYLLAKSQHGKFVLRIEDTDQNRYVEGAVEVIYATLKRAGLIHDEGPDVGGPYGPYVQSERKDLYRKFAEVLVRKGAAYYCFCEKHEEMTLRRRTVMTTMILPGMTAAAVTFPRRKSPLILLPESPM